jgi:hypothetical protein
VTRMGLGRRPKAYPIPPTRSGIPRARRRIRRRGRRRIAPV